MAEDVAHLLDEYAVRFRRGERPDLREYLQRAGEGADELARLVDAVLQAVPPPAASEEAVELSRAWVEGASPLLELRTRRRLRRADVVDALLEDLGLGLAQREKLRRRYHELETGQLEPERVDRRVWQALAETLQARVEDLAAWTRPAAAFDEGLAYYRVSEPVAASMPARAMPAEEPDEVDRLFGIGRA